MILKQLKQNGAEVSALTGIIVILLATSLFLPQTSRLIEHPENGTYLFKILYDNFCNEQNRISAQIISLTLSVLEAFLIIIMNLKQELTRAKGTFFLFVFFLVNLSFIPHNTLLPEQVANVFIILGFTKILSSHGVDKAMFECFDMGFYFALAALFCEEAIFMLIIGFIALMVYRPYIFNEYAVYIIGFITPVFFYLSIYYITEGSLQPIIENYKDLLVNKKDYSLPYIYFYYAAISFIMIVAASIFILGEYPKYNLLSTRTYKMFFILFLLAVTLSICPYFSFQAIRLASMPLTMLYVTVFYNFNNRRTTFSEIIFSIFFIAYISIHVLCYVI